LVCLFFGPAIGWIARKSAPTLIASGRWIWVATCPFVLVEILTALLRRAPLPVPYLPETLLATGNNEGLGVFLFTLPCCCAIGYSIGMSLTQIRIGRNLLIGSGSAAAWLVLFCCLLVSARSYEKQKLDAWSKVRTVIDPNGLPFARDPSLLCRSNPEASPLAKMIPYATVVQSVRVLSCDAGQRVEQVQLLTGPYAGNQGWVPQYGLQPSN
jgi:hypothetical protein